MQSKFPAQVTAGERMRPARSDILFQGRRVRAGAPDRAARCIMCRRNASTYGFQGAGMKRGLGIGLSVIACLAFAAANASAQQSCESLASLKIANVMITKVT